jgi:diaminopimelate epimerase
MQLRETYADLVVRDLSLQRAKSGEAAPEAQKAGFPSQFPAHRRFRKYQASGNDYVVLDPNDWPEPPSPELLRKICDRHCGIGADGVLWGPLAPTEPFALRLFNPDGSEFEKSGNGLSIFARYLWDRGIPSGPYFTMSTPGGPVTADILDAAGSKIGLEMGRISFDSQQIPVSGPQREVLREPVTLDDREIEITAVTIGNPHCVIFADDLPECDPVERGKPGDLLARMAQDLGPVLEHHPLFPKRANVQIVRVLDRHTLRVAVWERGAGYTLASGTSSCAAAGAAIRLARCDSPITVQMPGGSLHVQIAEDWSARIECPVVPVFAGELSGES